MRPFELAYRYFLWHYTLAFRDLSAVAGNFIWFVWNLFSVPLLFKTLFSPWRRVEEHEKGRNFLESFFSNLFLNAVSRVVGFLIRALTIFGGLLSVFIVICAGAVAVVVWLFLPLIVAGLFLEGVVRIFFN